MKTKKLQKYIPLDWQQVKFGDISKIYDGTHQTPDYTEAGIPFYSVEHVTSNNFNDTKFVSEDVYEKEAKRIRIEKGDILMTRIGDIGTTKYIDWSPKASFYVSLALIKCKKDVNSKFVDFVINSNKFKGELRARTLTVAFPNKINLGDIGKCELLIPSLSEQNRIVAVLEIWDKAIEKLTKKIEIKKQIKKGLTDQYVYKRKDSTEYFIDDLFELGRGRVIAKGEIESNPGAYPVYSSQTSNNGIFGTIDTYDFEGEYLTWTTDGAHAGRVFYRKGKFNCTNVCGTAKLKINLKANLYFIYSYLNYITKNYVSYVGNPKLMNGIFGKIQIKLPDIKEQDKITNILIVADKEIFELEKQLYIIKEQKKYLLNNLITGTIRTPEDLKIKI